jgi:hypothetical protein
MAKKINKIGVFSLIGSSPVKSGAGQGFKKMAFNAMKIARKLRDTEDPRGILWVRAEKRAFRLIDQMIEVEGLEVRNRLRARLAAHERAERIEAARIEFPLAAFIRVEGIEARV